VKKGTPGFKATKIDNKIALRCVQNADMLFERCFVPDSARLPGARRRGQASRRLDSPHSGPLAGAAPARVWRGAGAAASEPAGGLMQALRGARAPPQGRARAFARRARSGTPKPTQARPRARVLPVPAGVTSFKDTNKVLALSRIMVAWLPVGMAMGAYDMAAR
jgi:alkylation response protein AidB-like acyl-CoA dehydrogenase